MNDLPLPYGLRLPHLRAKENGVETYSAADGSGVIAKIQTLTSSSWHQHQQIRVSPVKNGLCAPTHSSTTKR